MTNFEIAKDLRFTDDQDLAQILVMFKKMCDNDDNYDETKEENYELTADDLRNFDAKATGAWIGEWMDEVIHSEEVEISAWWKQPTPKEKFLKNDAEYQQRRLMETAMTVSNIYWRMIKEEELNDGNYFGDINEVLCDLAREFEYKFFETDEYEDDYVGLLEKWLPGRLKEELE